MAHSGILKPSRLGWVILALAVFIIVFLLVTADGPYLGRVVDAETKEPIEGAAVVAVWTKNVFAWVQSNQWFEYAHEEVTDEHGEFEVSGLPWHRHIRLFLNPFEWMEASEPDFYILKPGYGWYPQHQLNPPRQSKVLMLEHFKDYVVIELPQWRSLIPQDKWIHLAPRCLSGGLGSNDALPALVPTYIKYINEADSLALGKLDGDITC